MIDQLRVLLSKQEVYSMGMRILLKTFNFVPLAVQVIKVGCCKLQPVTELVQVGCYNANCCGQEFCSVGDDSCLILWDARRGSSPVVKVEKADNVDLHCVDWNPIDENLIVTGSADNTIRLFDHRNLTTNGIGSPIHIFENHTAAVLCVQWSLDKSSVFGSSAEDGILNVWDHNKIGESSGPASNDAQSLLFRHSGHRYLGVTSVH